MVCSRCSKAGLWDAWCGVCVEEGTFGLGVPAPIIISSRRKKRQKKHQYNRIVKLVSAACKSMFFEGVRAELSVCLRGSRPVHSWFMADITHILNAIECGDSQASEQ